MGKRKAKPIVHIIASDPDTEEKVMEIINFHKEENPDFLEEYELIISHKGEIDVKVIEQPNKVYEYNVVNKLAYLGWSHELKGLNKLGKKHEHKYFEFKMPKFDFNNTSKQ